MAEGGAAAAASFLAFEASTSRGAHLRAHRFVVRTGFGERAIAPAVGSALLRFVFGRSGLVRQPRDKHGLVSEMEATAGGFHCLSVSSVMG